ncbi:GntR family transcriptional regulator [Candidatus Sumerlaeota bacterium]|nr:GntR family transcriptional regulator [Candidatus Sumerlaeota bacterium]
MVLAHKSKDPVYKKLKETIIKEIQNGTLKENDTILSERLLTEKFNISRISVRKAVSELIEENYLYTIPGKGTFVKGLTSKFVPPARRTNNIGYIFWSEIPSVISIPYFAHIIRGAEKESLKHNYHLLISTMSGTTSPGGRTLPSVIKQGKVDGVILEGIDLESWFEINKVIPCLIISNYICDPNKTPNLDLVDYVTTNNEKAMRNILEYLREMGHQNIGFIYQNLSHSNFFERMQGFFTNIKNLDLKTRDQWIANGNTGYDAMEKILSQSTLPTAVVAANDTFALDAISVCRDKGLNIPEDISLVGYDDIQSSLWSHPPLTTVRVRTEEMGKLAARRLIEKIEDPDSVSTHILVGTELIVRDSVKKIS